MIVLFHRHLSGVQMQFRYIRGVVVSVNIVKRRLHERKLQLHRPTTGSWLTRAHQRSSLRLTREHVNWTWLCEKGFCSLTNLGFTSTALIDGERFTVDLEHGQYHPLIRTSGFLRSFLSYYTWCQFNWLWACWYSSHGVAATKSWQETPLNITGTNSNEGFKLEFLLLRHRATS